MYSYAKVRYTNQSSIRVNTFELNGKYQVMPNLLGGLAFIYSDGSEGGATALSDITKGTKPRWFQVNAGGMYSFSGRFAPYRRHDPRGGRGHFSGCNGLSRLSTKPFASGKANSCAFHSLYVYNHDLVQNMGSAGSGAH